MIGRDAYVIDSIEKGCKSALAVDLRMKLKMAHNFLRKNDLKMEINEVTPRMLGLNQAVFDSLARTANIDRTATKRVFMHDTNEAEIHSDIITYTDIREILLEKYIDKQIIPTMLHLKLDLKNKTYFCSDYAFKQCLKRHGFVWRRLPQTKQSIIVEDPKRVHERYRYFKKLQEYRDQNRPIVYIEEKCFATRNGNTLDFELEPVFIDSTKWYIIIATEDGLINTYTYIYESAFNYITWLNDMVMPFLPKNSVIVIEDKLNWEQQELTKIGEFSCKNGIKQWLDQNGVQYDPGMNRAELILLINTFTEEKSRKLSNYLKGLGYDILRRQKGFPGLGLTAPIGRFIKKSYSKMNIRNSASNGKELMDTIKDITREQWRKMNECIKKEEKRVYEEDVLLDEVIDRIVALAAGTGVLGEELDDFQHDSEYYIFKREHLET